MSEGIRFEHYEVMRREDGTALELGRGAMGITYKAWDSDLHCEVALKVINPTLLSSQEARDRFLREARATAQLHHPNIATVFRLGRTESDTHFYAMEFCDGPTLELAVKTEGPFPAREALPVALQATKALILAEERRLMHRDIKPTNLILTERPGEGRVVKIIDFGLAKSFDDGRQTLATLGSSGFAGTAYFASPEQLEEKEDLDIRSDIYSLGACLWFMLTGHPPFEGPIALVMSRTLYAELPWENVADHPAPVIALLHRMLAKNRDERPPTAAALREEIEACLQAVETPSANGHVPTLATEAPPMPLTQRFHPIEEIAHDSMGRLFRAIDHAQNGAPVWYRLIDPTLTAVPATRRELEAQIAAAHGHPHPNFVNIVAAETTEHGLVIIQDYVEGFSLFELLKHRGMVTPQEALLILEQLAQAADHATGCGARGLNLSKEQVFVHLPGSSTDRSFDQILTRPLSQWPPYEIKANVLSLGDAGSSHAGSLQSMMTMAPGFARDTGVGEVGAMANLACELLGGRGGQTFTPIPRLTEAANRVLSSACANAGAYPSASAFVEALRESAGKMTAAAEPRHSILNPPPPPRQRPPTSPLVPWLIRAAVLVVIIGGVLGYYYGIYLPRERDRQHRADEAAAQQQEQQRLADEAAKAKAAAAAQAAADAARAKAEALQAQEEKEQQELASKKAADDAEAARLANARGGVIVKTDPEGATVALGGEDIQTSPATFKSLRLGKYPVKVSLAGYEQVEQEVEVKENEFTDMGTVSLSRSRGTMRVASTPSGLDYSISQNGVIISDGKTPATLPSLAVGDYDVSVKKGGWEIKDNVTVKRNDSVLYSPQFIGGSVTLVSTPAGATVMQGNTAMGKTPLTLTDLQPGFIRLDVKLNGYLPTQVTTTVQPAIQANLSSILHALPPPEAMKFVGTYTPNYPASANGGDQTYATQGSLRIYVDQDGKLRGEGTLGYQETAHMINFQGLATSTSNYYQARITNVQWKNGSLILIGNFHCWWDENQLGVKPSEEGVLIPDARFPGYWEVSSDKAKVKIYCNRAN